MHPTVRALRGLIETAIGKPVEVIEAPTDRIGTDGVRLWVWRADHAESHRRSPPGVEAAPGASGLRVGCLVFAPDLGTLQAVGQAAFASPVVVDGDQRVAILHDPLETGLLLHLFVAAKVQLRPCLSLVLTASAVS